MKRALRLLAPAAAVAVVLTAPAQAQSRAGLDVAISPGHVDTILGESFEVEATVTNEGNGPTAPLAAHIDITDPRQASSVDPEDWTDTLTQELGVIPPGQSRTVQWSLQPISGGNYTLYAVALATTEPDVYVSNAVTVNVLSNRPLNPEGVLPAVIAGPVVLGVLLGLVIRRSRSPWQRQESASI